jgi:hypothetical protein
MSRIRLTNLRRNKYVTLKTTDFSSEDSTDVSTIFIPSTEFVGKAVTRRKVRLIGAA